MTVAVPGAGGIEEYGGFDANIGLEDVDATDVVIPRFQIVHADGKFKNNLTGQLYDDLQVVMLGVVKQRIMWADEVDDGDKPLCKSPDHDHGFPYLDPDAPKSKQFPEAKSNFTLANFPPNGPQSINGLVTLPCSSCIFNQWDKGDWKNPPCSEQHTYPVLYTEDDGESWSPALMTFQKTGIKPSKTYISGFANSNKPMFTALTKITLEVNKRGTVVYSVPKFEMIGPSDRSSWGNYAQMYSSIREFVRTPPRRQDDGEAETITVPADANVNTGPAQAAASAPKSDPTPTPTAAPEPVAAAAPAPAAAASSDDDGDMPF